MTDHAQYSEDAEQAVIGALMMGSDAAVREARGIVTAASFYRAPHGEMFDAILALVDKGSIVDPLTLAAELAARRSLDSVGGKGYIGYLVDAVPDDVNVGHHAKIVQGHAKRRELAQIGRHLTEAASEPGADVEAIAREVSAQLLPLAIDDHTAGYRELRHSIWPVMEDIEARQKAGEMGTGTGILTGFPEIDRHTHGFRRGELVMFGGVAKAGKSVLVQCIALNIATQQHIGVGVVSIEMTRDEWTERSLVALSGVDANRIAGGAMLDDDFPRLARAAGTLSHAPIYIDDGAFPTLDTVLARATDLKAQHPDIAVIVVDYAQLIRHHMKGRRGDEELNAITRGLKGMAKQLDVLVIALAQLNFKGLEKRETNKPLLSDFQGGSGFVQDANFCGLIYRPRMYDPFAADTMEVNFAATRRAGNWTSTLKWDGERNRVLSFT